MTFAGPVGVIAALYIVTLLFLGWRGYRRRRVGSVADFYLAGSSLGVIVLFATLYATQYSGNTFLGYTGQAYRVGFGWTFSVGMMMSVVIVYLLFAPGLHRDAHRHGLVTPADWIRHRFGSPRIAFLVSLIMAISLLNYLYAQFLALGHFVAGASGGEIPYWAGVVGFGLVIAVYETLGGMRSVAWTDVVQGAMLFVGLGIVLVMAWPQIGSMEGIVTDLLATKPELVRPPTWRQCGGWLSSMLLLGVGAAMYPHAIQRIYAARSAAVLRRSLQVMVFMPFATTLVVLLVGIAAHGVLDGRADLATDRVMPAFLATIADGGGVAEWATALVLVGALAAMMSTADSALLSLSSIVTVDVVGRLRGGRAAEVDQARLAKFSSWGIVALMVALALQPPTTLWRLIEIKMELLIQVGPLFLFGVRTRRLSEAAAWRALLTGTLIAVAGFASGVATIGGIHLGAWAFAVNVSMCAWSVRRNPMTAPEPVVGSDGAASVAPQD